MKNPILFLLLASACTGCVSLTATTPTSAEWTTVALAPEKQIETKFGVTRLSQIDVRSPYDVRPLAVARPDGSLAFDAYNRFAAIPSHILKGVALDVLSATGRFKAVVPTASAAFADHLAEVTVSDFLLDCTEPGKIEASVGVSVLVLDAKREIVGAAKGSASADASSGNYGAAFSRAFSEALAKAVEKL